jgi:hypothetical protein
MAAKKKNGPDGNGRFSVKAYPYPICREQHKWVPHDGVIDHQKKLGYRIQRCENCPTKRHTIISLRVTDYGDTLSSSYRYPKDYRIVGGITSGQRGQIRAHNFLAELADGSA